MHPKEGADTTQPLPPEQRMQVDNSAMVVEDGEGDVMGYINVKDHWLSCGYEVTGMKDQVHHTQHTYSLQR